MITVFTSPTCVYCHVAMDYLKAKKLEYKEVDVSQDQKAAMWIMDKVGQIATPVIDINGSVILGFDKQKIDLALREHKLV